MNSREGKLQSTVFRMAFEIKETDLLRRVLRYSPESKEKPPKKKKKTRDTDPDQKAYFTLLNRGSYW